MKKYLTIALASGMFFVSSCSKNDATTDADTSENPFFTEWNTPFSVPPFDKIRAEHYRPALDSGFKAHVVEIEAITNNPEEPTFENTILALECAGELLNNVATVFYTINLADGDEAMKEIEAEYAPKFTSHTDEINMNEKLFARVKSVYDKREQLGLDSDDTRLIEHYYKNFVRGGTNLSAEKKAELKEINNKISELTTNFGQKMLAENNAFKIIVDKKEDLAGLPESSINAAAELATKNGQEGKWMFNTSKPSWIPFMQFSEKRELREKMYMGYVNRGNNNDENDTKDIVEQIAVLRFKKANLLGYKSWADYIISDNMAKTSKAANDLIQKVAKTTIPYATEEALELQKMAEKMGHNIKISPWDWWYYTEKVRSEKYSLDEEMIRPYFSLENLKQGVFDLTNKLYGLKFKKLDNMPVYNSECEVYEILNPDDTHLSLIYFDWHPRPTKKTGAWMSNYRESYYKNGERVAPIVTNVCNFTRPSGDTPALISIDEAETLFHEFGHALHGMFANTKYRSTSGTNTPRDYVELPSQIMENWTCHPEFIKTWAKHYKTGEPIPDSLISKIDASSKFNQGFITLELIAAAILDMDWHTIKDTVRRNAIEFETESMNKIGMIPEIFPRYSSWYFGHIWSSDFGYSAGYYGYTWSAVLDADAFQAFVETGDIYNKEIAAKFRDNILMLGASRPADQLYRQFRGKDPSSDAFFIRKGFANKK